MVNNLNRSFEATMLQTMNKSCVPLGSNQLKSWVFSSQKRGIHRENWWFFADKNFGCRDMSSMRGMEMGLLMLWPWGFANQDLSCQKLSVYCSLYIAVRLKLQFMSIGIRSVNLVGSKMVLEYQQWVYCILPTAMMAWEKTTLRGTGSCSQTQNLMKKR